MHNDSSPDGVSVFYDSIQEIQSRIIEGQKNKLRETAARMADTIAAGGRIFVFGTGHSHMLAEEGFYRAGGLAAVTPVFSPMLMLHEHAGLSSKLERMEGLAAPLLDGYNPQPGEMMVIFSNSGVNRLPVEMALYARQRGLTVVSVSSHAYARLSPLSSLGQRLDEAADIALDNGGPPGDALVPVPGQAWSVGPGSTILAAFIWNCLVVECSLRLQAEGVLPPVFVSFNMPAAASHNQALLEQWGKTNPHLK